MQPGQIGAQIRNDSWLNHELADLRRKVQEHGAATPSMPQVDVKMAIEAAAREAALADNQAQLDALNTQLATELPALDTRITSNETAVTQAQSDVDAAMASIDTLNTTVSDNSTLIATAQSAADAAKTAADQASTDAATAQSAADAASSAASTADSKAVTAQSKADQASSDAATAQTAANNAAAAASTADGKAVAAQTTADGKNKVIYSTSTASGANTAGDIWFQKDANGVILAQWEGLGGTSWAQKTISGAVIAALDAGKITTGTLAAAVLDAATIRAKFIAAGKVTAADITAGSLTSASGIFGTMDASVLNAGTINAARLVAGDIRAAFLAAGKVTAADMVAGTLTSASGVFGTLDASIINAGTLAATRIAAGSLTADKLLIGGSANALPDPAFANSAVTSARFVRSSGGTAGWTSNPGTGTTLPYVSHLTTTTNDGFQYAPFSPSASNANMGIPVVAGQKWLLSVDVGTDISAGVRWNVYKWLADGTEAFTSLSPYNTGTGQRNLSYVYTIPAGVVAIYPALACNVSGVNWSVYGNGVVALQANATLIEDGSITTTEIASRTILAADIKAGEITATEIKAGTITANELAANSVTATQILAGSVGTNHMVANTINADRLVANSITADKLSATAIDGKTITGVTVNARGASSNATLTARMGPTAAFDPSTGSGVNVPGIGFVLDTPLAQTAGLFSPDGKTITLSQGASAIGSGGGSKVSLGNDTVNVTANQGVNLTGSASVSVSSNGPVAINGTSVKTNGYRPPQGLLAKLGASGALTVTTTKSTMLSQTVTAGAGVCLEIKAMLDGSTSASGAYVAFAMLVNGVEVKNWTAQFDNAGSGQGVEFTGTYDIPSVGSYTVSLTGQVVVGGGTYNIPAPVPPKYNAKLLIKDIGDY